MDAVARMGLACLLALATFGFHQPIPRTVAPEDADVFLPRPELAKTAALGFEAVLSDYYWIQALYKVGSEVMHSENFGPYVAKIIDVVTTLNPHVDHPYRFAAIWLYDSPESVMRGNEMLERGISHHPDDWRNHFYLGFNYFYYLDDTERAADALEVAASLEGSPTYLPRLVARLRSQNASLESAVIFLHQLVESAPNEEEKAVYQGALDEIGVELKARHLDRAREAYKKLHGKDIESLGDLVRGAHSVLEELPRPEPADMPATLRKGDHWFIDEETGLITSSYYRHRYQPVDSGLGRGWDKEAIENAKKKLARERAAKRRGADES